MALDALSVKYRPKTLTDLIGQAVVVQSITNAFKYKTLSHAYIMAGKYGCGKTSGARIMAAMENCEKGPTLEPCGVCQNCREIFEGKSIDVKELDAASNGSIERIREIAKEIRSAPVDCRVKYLIFDEAHRLTGAAAEASLKMIEEPPEGVRFILATTDPHLLKDTVHSRCITFTFHKVSWTEMYENLKKVIAAEKIDIEDNAIKLACRRADGSVRNSIVNLQTLLNYAGENKITFEDARKVLGAIDEQMFFNLVDAALEVNTPKGMLTIEDLLKDGKPASEVLNGYFLHLRNLMLAKTCGKDLASLGFSEEDTARYQHQGKTINTELVLQMMKFLEEVSHGMEYNLDPQHLLEKHLIETIIWKKKFDAKAAANKAKPAATAK